MLMRTLYWLIGAAIIAAVLLYPFSVRPTNCGGNTEALSWAQNLASEAWVEADQAPDGAFCFASPTDRQRTVLAEIAWPGACRRGRNLISTASVLKSPPASKRVVVVCDTPYTNVPERLFWFLKASPTHAAGFSDGTYGLISPAEFAALDRSTFVPLDELYLRWQTH